MHDTWNEDAESNAMVLAGLLKGLLKFRDSLVSILLKNAIAMSQQEYPMQDDEVNRCTHIIETPNSGTCRLAKPQPGNLCHLRV